MSNLQKKELLSAFIAIKTTESMKSALEKLALKDEREFSDFIRIQWKKLLEKKK